MKEVGPVFRLRRSTLKILEAKVQRESTLWLCWVLNDLVPDYFFVRDSGGAHRRGKVLEKDGLETNVGRNDESKEMVNRKVC